MVVIIENKRKISRSDQKYIENKLKKPSKRLTKKLGRFTANKQIS